jgi:hypothetical protein
VRAVHRKISVTIAAPTINITGSIPISLRPQCLLCVLLGGDENAIAAGNARTKELRRSVHAASWENVVMSHCTVIRS